MNSLTKFAPGLRGSPLDQAHAALLAKTDIQFDLPTFKRPQDPAWLGRLLLESWPYVKWALIGFASIVTVILIYYLVRHLWGHDWGSQEDTPHTIQTPAQVWRPTEAEARQLLAESDTLARDGRFAEAVHLLLLRSIEDFDNWRPHVVRRNSTSREIGQLEAMPNSARSTFRRIAGVVEQSIFGSSAVNAEMFARCRADYENFAFPPVWQEAAAR